MGTLEDHHLAGMDGINATGQDFGRLIWVVCCDVAELRNPEIVTVSAANSVGRPDARVV